MALFKKSNKEKKATVTVNAFSYLFRMKTVTKGDGDFLCDVPKTVTPYGDEDECESMAICAMAEVIATWNDATGHSGGVSSEHIGSVSVTYASVAEIMPKGLGPALMASVSPWLHVKVATMPYA